MMHRIGDRVERRTDVFDQRSKMRYGRVASITGRGRDAVYRVRWDDGVEDGGYFEHGLSPSVDWQAKAGASTGEQE